MQGDLNMQKFKVGDHVERINKGFAGVRKGEKATITEVEYMYRLDKGKQGRHNEQNLRLVSSSNSLQDVISRTVRELKEDK